eukprot:scaffold11327_cov51-Isochrysis_galbana.AAC.1
MIEKLPTPELGDYVQKCFLQASATPPPSRGLIWPGPHAYFGCGGRATSARFGLECGGRERR